MIFKYNINLNDDLTGSKIQISIGIQEFGYKKYKSLDIKNMMLD